ncbi:hypothetical protein HYDPIDRAFT_112886 [Hydnomerulius pinastri MD-312]|uniref:Uncharacterized protein n=1 Tax=Hydnomerulius pinastri MD-312 TaxID=994086 RepID=A0A0C9WEM1_9AGAM|nr:hypothetical protein HYDPIDRAFT_112886 [Hydnomerulius pinastri MD-312]
MCMYWSQNVSELTPEHLHQPVSFRMPCLPYLIHNKQDKMRSSQSEVRAATAHGPTQVLSRASATATATGPEVIKVNQGVQGKATFENEHIPVACRETSGHLSRGLFWGGRQPGQGYLGSQVTPVSGPTMCNRKYQTARGCSPKSSLPSIHLNLLVGKASRD